MPKMTKPWLIAATVMTVLGFVAVAIQGNVLGAVINGVIWFGIVYLIFLVAYGARKATRRDAQPPPEA